MRIAAILLSLALTLVAPGLRAQNPGAQQDAEAAREKLLKASDELDNIQANSENTRVAVDGVKTDVAALKQNITDLQAENAALKQQLADLQASFAQYKADQAHERQALIDNVASMIAAGKSASKKKKETSDTAASSASPETTAAVHTDSTTTAPSLAPPPDPGQPATSSDTPPAPKKQKGYYYTVAPGDTVGIIAAAYRDQGVKVTSSQIRKANGLTTESVLKPGEKLFIPKPGT